MARTKGTTLGRLLYGGGDRYLPLDDRLLAHLQVVFGSKLRRQESFMLSVVDSSKGVPQRRALWFESAIPLEFEFDSDEHHALNKEWLEELALAAASSHGVVVEQVPEPSSSTPNAAQPRTARAVRNARQSAAAADALPEEVVEAS
ncbi:hypothetical protein MN032_03740 [Agromyces atrinae]|uniref:DUF7882 family protein n=1 Tax=Agromyces atrinae TaxID=592376 RepID=UPI001F58F1A2|nr:hypothetical protein [Agromyces atrinae]MCI2956797.1 hypothetical protein [Agromyces atrinae]